MYRYHGGERDYPASADYFSSANTPLGARDRRAGGREADAVDLNGSEVVWPRGRQLQRGHRSGPGPLVENEGRVRIIDWLKKNRTNTPPHLLMHQGSPPFARATPTLLAGRQAPCAGSSLFSLTEQPIHIRGGWFSRRERGALSGVHRHPGGEG